MGVNDIAAQILALGDRIMAVVLSDFDLPFWLEVYVCWPVIATAILVTLTDAAHGITDCIDYGHGLIGWNRLGPIVKAIWRGWHRREPIAEYRIRGGEDDDDADRSTPDRGGL